MSGHITRMSRGSRVGSSSSRPTSTSRSTSTWRAVPWQACTWRLRSSTRCGCGSSARPRSARGWRAGRAGASRARWSASASGAAETSPDGKPPASKVRRSSRASRPSEASSGCPTTSAEASSSRATDAAVPGERVPQRRRGLRQPEVHVAVLAERAEQLDLGDRQPGVTEQREPVGQVEPVTAGPRAGRRSARAGRRAGPRAPASQQPPPQLGLPDQVLVEGPPGAVGVARPSRQSVTSCGRCTAYDANSRASRIATE